jgi:putative ABC transport system ATP-binding protein
MINPVIELTAVSRVFDEGGPVSALVDVNLSIAPGEFVAITGRSGSGKTTLLNILGLLDRPTSGTYRLAGENASALSDDNRTRIRGRRIGLVFQNSHLIQNRTSLENVELALQLAGFPRGIARRQWARKLVESVGLSHRVHARARTLSGGERQRVALARALSARPVVLLCDEPTGNLDVETGARVMGLIKEVPLTGASVVLVTHDLELARQADRVIALRDGTPVPLGSS